MTTKCLSIILFTALSILSVSAQTTEFTYQGVLNSGATPATGNYDFEFLLFDAVTGGTQIGSTITRAGVAIADGRFAVNLDFGAQFPGADRYLEIRVRTAGSGAYTILDPRQRIRSNPYSVRSLNSATSDTATNAQNLGGVAANQYVLTGDARLTDARAPLPFSPNYIQNLAAGTQASSNFNISGTGSASIFNAATRYDIGGNRALSMNAGNVFVGINAGISNTQGDANAFLGSGVGISNTTGTGNSFYGASAGSGNTTGNQNSFFGHWSGLSNTTGFSNSFYGTDSGRDTTTGSENSFFGFLAGRGNTMAIRNAFFGISAGQNNTTGSSNSYFGSFAGLSNITECCNTFVGANSNAVAGVFNSVAVGYRAQVNQSNSLVLGGINGINGATADTNVGIGTTMPAERLHVVGNGLFTGSLTVNGTLNAALSGNGSALTNLNAANITTGTLNAARLPDLGASYVKNGIALQPFSNFNISGTGTANILNVATQYNIGGIRVFYVGGTGNTFAGPVAGAANITGSFNSFFGESAGNDNTSGNANSFFGRHAGLSNTVGFSNTFVGVDAGALTVSGNGNSFFGDRSGQSNTTGSSNTFVGGLSNGLADLHHATALGYQAQVTQNYSMVLGSIDGVNSAAADTNVGIGTTAPSNRFHVRGLFNATATPVNHVVLFENTSTGTSPDVLALRIGRATDPDDANNFITFFKGDNTSAGSIQGNAAGGVMLGGPGSDYAEWLPRLDPNEKLEPGDIVGVFDGRVSKTTTGASHVMAVSTGAIVAGNDPGEKRRETHSLIAFIGQATLNVIGPVRAGDYIIPSGSEDGTAMSVSADEITAAQFRQVIGQAWERSDASGPKPVRAVIGLIRHDPAVVRLLEQIKVQQRQIDLLIQLVCLGNRQVEICKE